MSDFDKFAEAYAGAWSTQDIEAILSFFADDCVYEDVALSSVNKGKQELEEFLKATFAAVPDFRIDPQAAFTCGDRAASEWVISGTQTGPFPGIPATSKPFSVRGVSIMELKQGKIRRNTDYWSLAEFLRQLGLFPDSPTA